MDEMAVGPRSAGEIPRISGKKAAQPEAIGHRGFAEIMLGVILDATCGAAIPVMLTVHVGEPLREGGFDLVAHLAHADSRRQQWIAEIRQKGAFVSRTHVVLETELPSSSYVPWHDAIRFVPNGYDDDIAHCLRVARLIDTAVRSRADNNALVPLWFTIRYFNAAGQSARLGEPLLVSAIGAQRLGTLQQYELEVIQTGERVAALTAVYQRDHA